MTASAGPSRLSGSQIRRFLSDTLGMNWTLAFLFSILIPAVLRLFIDIPRFVVGLLATNISIEGRSPSVITLSPFLSSLTTVGFILIWFFIILFVRLARSVWLTGFDAEKTTPALKQLLAQVTRQAARIYDQGYPPEEKPRSKIENLSVSYTIYGDARGYWVWREARTAVDRPIHMLRHTHAEWGDRETLFAELRLNVASHTAGTDVTWLPCKDEPRGKGITVAFLPAIQPGKTVEYEYSIEWPRMAGLLLENHRDTFEIVWKSDANVPKIEIAIGAAPGIRNIDFEVTGPNLGTPGAPETTRQGIRVWRTQISNAPASGSYKLEMSL